MNPTTPSPLSVGTPGDKRSLPWKTGSGMRWREQAESGEGKSMDETLSEAGEQLEVGKTSEHGEA